MGRLGQEKINIKYLFRNKEMISWDVLTFAFQVAFLVYFCVLFVFCSYKRDRTRVRIAIQ